MSFRSLNTLLYACLVLAAGCDDTPLDLANETRVSLLLTDAPGDVAAVWVEITEITLHGGAEDGPGDVVLLDESTGLVEITSLVSTAQDLVTDAAVDPGVYSQLRMVVGQAVLETETGAVFTSGGGLHPDGLESTGELKCPSCSNSGIKVKLPGGSVETEEGDNTFVLDFDVSQTFGHEAGNSGKWIMRPVIHASKMEGSESGIDGTVTVATDAAGEPTVTIPECPTGTVRGLADFLPLATAATLLDSDGNPVTRTGSTEDDGTFHVGFLEPDDYDMGYASEIEFTDFKLLFSADVDPASVSVVEAETVSGVAYTITGATCEAF